MTVKTSTPPSRLTSVQPWLRDHYAALREEAGPRWNQTRAVVMPVMIDATHKVRDEYVPAVLQLSSRQSTRAMDRSAPIRAEAANRAIATAAAVRGQVRTEQIAKLQRQHGRRKLWFVLSATAAGAAAGVALVLWQRSRSQDWVEDDAVHTTLESDHPAQGPMRETPTGSDSDDPSNPDAGPQSSGPRPKHHARH